MVRFLGDSAGSLAGVIGWPDGVIRWESSDGYAPKGRGEARVALRRRLHSRSSFGFFSVVVRARGMRWNSASKCVGCGRFITIKPLIGRRRKDLQREAPQCGSISWFRERLRRGGAAV